MDFRDFHVKGEKRPNKELEARPRWWLEEENLKIAQSVSAALEVISKDQNERLKQYLISTRLYGNLGVSGPSGTSFSKLSSTHPVLKDKISYNVVQSAVDTIVSKTTKNRPKPLALTNGGSYKEQRKAKKLNRFTEGVFYEQKAYEKGEVQMLDGCIWGDGPMHVYATDEDRVGWERVLPHELWVDKLEAFYGEPRNLHRCKDVDREVASAFVTKLHKGSPKLLKELLKAVAQAPAARPDAHGTYGTVSDLITIRESWHLPSGKDTGDGRHVLTIEGATLFAEEWKRRRFPFTKFTWSRRRHGYWGQGLAEQLQPIQLEVNKLMTIIQRSFHLGGTFKVLLENGSKIVKEHLNNDVGALVMYSGTKPDYIVPPLVPPEIYRHLQTLRDAAYEQAGISQLSASSQLPQGVESGKAMRTLNNIESERFISIGHAYERFYMDAAALSIETAKEIAARHKGHYMVKVPGRVYFEDLDWSDVDLEEDCFVMQVMPISSLPNDPAGRLETVQEYIQAGFFTPRQGKKLMDFPDLEAAEGLQAASEDYLTKILDLILDEGVYTPPDQFDDLELGRVMALEYYQRGKASDLEEEKLEMLIRFVGQIDARKAAAQKQLQEQQTAQQMQQAQAGVQPQAEPEPPPTSDIIPNVPGMQQ